MPHDPAGHARRRRGRDAQHELPLRPRRRHRRPRRGPPLTATRNARSPCYYSSTPEATLETGGMGTGALDRALAHASAVVGADTPEDSARARSGRFQLLAVTRRGPPAWRRSTRPSRRRFAGMGTSRPTRTTVAAPSSSPRTTTPLASSTATSAWPGPPSAPRPSYSPTDEGGTRVHPGRPPSRPRERLGHDVHKSQGSEFDAVAVVLPPEPTPLLTRELLYTAVTRARHEVVVCGAARLVTHAAVHSGRLASHLGKRLLAASLDSGGNGH